MPPLLQLSSPLVLLENSHDSPVLLHFIEMTSKRISPRSRYNYTSYRITRTSRNNVAFRESFAAIYFPLFFQRFPSQIQYLRQEKRGRYFHVNFSPGQEKVQCGTDTNVKNLLNTIHFPISHFLSLFNRLFNGCYFCEIYFHIFASYFFFHRIIP